MLATSKKKKKRSASSLNDEKLFATDKKISFENQFEEKKKKHFLFKRTGEQIIGIQFLKKRQKFYKMKM